MKCSSGVRRILIGSLLRSRHQPAQTYGTGLTPEPMGAATASPDTEILAERAHASAHPNRAGLHRAVPILTTRRAVRPSPARGTPRRPAGRHPLTMSCQRALDLR